LARFRLTLSSALDSARVCLFSLPTLCDCVLTARCVPASFGNAAERNEDIATARRERVGESCGSLGAGKGRDYFVKRFGFSPSVSLFSSDPLRLRFDRTLCARHRSLVKGEIKQAAVAGTQRAVKTQSQRVGREKRHTRAETWGATLYDFASDMNDS
jgi:hypothetical protein